MRRIILLTPVAALIFLGCSGHTLQDWADKHINEKEQRHDQTSDDTPSTTQTQKRMTSQTDASAVDSAGLESISPSKPARSEGGLLQEHLDSWMDEEWTPATEQDASVKAMNEDDGRPFTLQEYVDKIDVYLDSKSDEEGASHKERMDALPVIGK